MKCLLIVNPVAGQGRPDQVQAEMEAALGPLLAAQVTTQGSGDALKAARQAGASGQFDALLVAGGDGTVNEAINGLLLAGGGVASPLPLGLLPMGTQNVLAHELGLRGGDLETLAGVVRGGHTRRIDVGCAGGRYFALMAGFGFDAAVVGDVQHAFKSLLGPAAYAFATLGTLAKYRSTSVRLQIDDAEVSAEAFLIVVANAASYAYRQIKLAPFASLDDGWLDVCVFERPLSDRVGFATQIMAVLAKRHLRDPRVRYYRARHVGIESDPPITGQLDGDRFQQTPISIDVVPRALPIFVPV